MRFATAIFAFVLLAVTPDQAGFTIAVPGGWVEQPTVEQATVSGFHKSDPDDTDVAFAWSSSDASVVAIVQAMTSSSQIKAGTYRANSEALVNAVAQSMGMKGAHSTVGDDGTVVTGNADGDYGSAQMHLVMINQAMVDSTRHLRGYSAVCAMRQPVTDSARSTCTALLNSFKVTLDPSTLLPLEAK